MSISSTSAAWRRMICVSPEGRQEALWVEPVGAGDYRVLNPPVWTYGVSVGSVVQASERSDGFLAFQRLVRASDGATVRVIAPDGIPARDVYLSRLIPAAQALGLDIGPATFFNPRLAAVHVQRRAEWWPEVGKFLDGLVRDGTIEQWEVADPDVYAADCVQREAPMGEILMHQLPAVEVKNSESN